MKKDIAEMFGLQAFRILGSTITEEAIILRVMLNKKHIICPHCKKRKFTCYEKGKLRRVTHQYWGKKDGYPRRSEETMVVHPMPEGVYRNLARGAQMGKANTLR